MKIINAVCVGAGNRGRIYANFAKEHGDRMRICAVVDPDAIRRSEFAERHSITANMQFESIEELVKAGVKCDLVINATMDNIHYETTKVLLGAGYDVMLEKPVTAKQEELLELRDLAVSNGRNLFICHLMRYTPFYKGIKKHILDGDIGNVVSVKMCFFIPL